MNKPPAFQFYAKDWLSSPSVRAMSMHLRGIYITVLAAMWDSDEPGTLTLPIEVAAKSAGLDPRSLRDFVSKSPRCLVEIDGKLVNEKLREQAVKYREISGKRAEAARLMHAANAQQKHRSASSSASSSAKQGEALHRPSQEDRSGTSEKHGQELVRARCAYIRALRKAAPSLLFNSKPLNQRQGKKKKPSEQW